MCHQRERLYHTPLHRDVGIADLLTRPCTLRVMNVSHRGIQPQRTGSTVPEQSSPSFSSLPAASLLLSYEGNW